MSQKMMNVGDPIDCRCSKCRKITNHVIVAMADGTPAKVECNTCQGQHKFRRPATVRKAPASRSPVDPRLAEQKEWQTLRTDIESRQAMAYSMEAAFKIGAVIRHPVFGLGLVQSKIGPRKIDVLFSEGRKKMRCR